MSKEPTKKEIADAKRYLKSDPNVDPADIEAILERAKSTYVRLQETGDEEILDAASDFFKKVHGADIVGSYRSFENCVRLANAYSWYERHGQRGPTD